MSRRRVGWKAYLTTGKVLQSLWVLQGQRRWERLRVGTRVPRTVGSHLPLLPLPTLPQK